MLSATVVAVLLLAAAGAAVWARFSRRGLWTSIGVFEALGVLLLGLPGAAFLETAQPVMERLGRDPITGDAAWPAAILMSIVWPFALVPAYSASRHVSENLKRGLAALVLLMLLCAGAAMVIYQLVA